MEAEDLPVAPNAFGSRLLSARVGRVHSFSGGLHHINSGDHDEDQRARLHNSSGAAFDDGSGNQLLFRAFNFSEIGQIERFPSAKHLCSYAGLVPACIARAVNRSTAGSPSRARAG